MNSGRDLGSSTTRVGADGRSTAELLDDLSASVQARRRCEVEEFQTIIAWADANTVDDLAHAATIRDSYVDTGLPLAGDGAPLVSEFALMELCATLERSLDGGREHVAKIVETGWRLPQVRDAVVATKVPVWKALRVADLTRPLSTEAAGFVDRHLAFALPTCTWAQVERLVAEAIIRFDPDTAEERRREESEHRHVRVFAPEAGSSIAHLPTTLDAGDALDLDAAVGRRAKVLGRLGNTETLDVRRSLALGEIARQDLTLDLEVADPDTGEIKSVVPGRKVDLHLHLTDHALASTVNGSGCVGRWGNTQTPVTAQQVRHWCRLTGSRIIVRPVLDLKDHVPVDAYEIPDRHKTRVRLRDHTTPHAQGGVTCPCNLVPLCRRHHRAKTFDHWRSTIVEPGTYLWTSPHGQHWLVDHTGTRTLARPRSLAPAPEPPDRADPGRTDPEPPEP